jgi:hypothetical protein
VSVVVMVAPAVRLGRGGHPAQHEDYDNAAHPDPLHGPLLL